MPPRLRRTFANRKPDETLGIKGLVDQYRQAQVTKLEIGVFSQEQGLADAKRNLVVKEN